jgi:hypothetical protein
MSDHPATSLLIGNNLLCFAPGATAQEKADIQDCLLLAELRTSELHSRGESWERWMDVYQQNLVDGGLVLQDRTDQQSAVINRRRDFPRKTAALISTVPSPRLVEIASGALADMYASAHAQHFFDSWFSAGRSDTFQVIPCERTATGRVDLLICGLQMNTRMKPRVSLWLPIWPIAYEMTLSLKAAGFLYDAAAYDPLRERVQAELTAMSKHTVARIEL